MVGAKAKGGHRGGVLVFVYMMMVEEGQGGKTRAVGQWEAHEMDRQVLRIRVAVMMWWWVRSDEWCNGGMIRACWPQCSGGGGVVRVVVLVVELQAQLLAAHSAAMKRGTQRVE